MSFEIKLNIELLYDSSVDKYFLNGIEVDEYTIRLLNLSKLNLISKKENHNIVFDLVPETVKFIKEKYYKN